MDINSFFLNNSAIDFNFYVFASDVSSEDLFSYQNPKSVDNYYSLLNVNDKTDSQFSYIKPCHLTTFLKKWSDNALVKIPIIGLSEVYNNKSNPKIYPIIFSFFSTYTIFFYFITFYIKMQKRGCKKINSF